MDGFLLINKPKNITSFGLCNKIKKKLNIDKIGHNGTLDPNAEGLMLIGINKATKLLKLFDNDTKEYIAKIIFGYDSDTLDMDSKNIKEIKSDINIEDIPLALNELKLQDKQIPPLTSAIKINGKKLYQYQRENIDIEISERNVKLYDYELINSYYVDDHLEIEIRLVVSKGYYIRSFARDLGELLNTCAIVHELKRTKIGKFNIIDSKDLDNINTNDIIPIKSFLDLPIVEVKDYLYNMVLNGITLDERQTNIDGAFYVKCNCDIIAIYEKKEDNKYKPIIIFK